jgi:hypothetical protein
MRRQPQFPDHRGVSHLIEHIKIVVRAGTVGPETDRYVRPR